MCNDGVVFYSQRLLEKKLKPIVAWNEGYSVGMTEIDAQHKVLLDLINQLWTAIVNRCSLDDQMKLIEGLERYTVLHFTEEENFMQSVKYAGFERHQKFHQAFIQKIAAEKSSLQSTKHISLDIVHFLNDWLVQHIMVEDKSYARHCTDKAIAHSSVSQWFKGLFGHAH